jgi:hypothetical protein
LGWIRAALAGNADLRQVYTIIRRSSPAYPQLLAGENRLKNRFNLIFSNGDFW